MDTIDRLAKCQRISWQDEVSTDDLSYIDDAAGEAIGEIQGLQIDLTELAEKTLRYQQVIRELLDRLADHRRGLLTIDEVLAGAMFRELSVSDLPRYALGTNEAAACKVWATARDWEVTEVTL